MKPLPTFLCLSASILSALVSHAAPLGTEFSYSGVLQNGAQPAQGGYDLRLSLYDAAAEGTRILDARTNLNVSVSNGVFRTAVDFGAEVFDGRATWLEVGVRPAGSSDDFEVLSPRQALLAVPHALHALTAGSAQSAESAVTATSATTALTAATATTAEGLSPNTVNTAAIQDETITAAKIASGQVVKSLNGLQDHVLLSAGANIVLDATESGLTFSSPVWSLSGNQGTTAGMEFVGTTDDQPLELKVNNLRALRLEPTTNAPAVNIVAGSPDNAVAAGVYGATIGGGGGRLATTVIYPQIVRSIYGTIGGGAANTIDTNAVAATVGGGFSNQVTQAREAVIAGGSQNLIRSNAWRCTISGGWMHTIGVDCYHSVVSGGWSNSIAGNSSVIGGGTENAVLEGARYSVIGGGGGNVVEAGAFTGTIAGGGENVIQAVSYRSTIGGGKLNNIGPTAPHSTIGGGITNRILENAEAATIPGGSGNSVGGAFGFAAGRRAAAAHTGAFAWADSVDADFASQADNEFAVRATGGVRLVSAVDESGQPTAGVALAPGSGSWSTLSDRAAKRNFEPVDGRRILKQLAALPIQTWNYAQQDKSVRHLGPMAQDFQAAFHLGENERTISTVDADGVALAAIQGLHTLILEQKSELEARDARIERLERELQELREMLSRRVNQ